MKISDLRIGNYIRHNVKEDGVEEFLQPNEDAISEDDMWHFTGGVGFETAEPIALTEEWLLKLGFHRENNAYVGPDIESKNSYTNPEVSIWNPIGDPEFRLNDSVYCPKLEFVHQLQNLYFSLTGLELTIVK